MGDSHHESVSHAERPLAVRHPRIGPARGKALQPVEFLRNEPAIAAIDPDDVLEARGARASLAREDGPRRVLGQVREGHGTLGVEVLVARLLVDAGLALGPLEVLPLGNLHLRHVEPLGHLVLRNEHAAQGPPLPRVGLDDVAGHHMAPLHRATLQEGRGLAAKVERRARLVRVRGNVELGELLRSLDRQRPRHHAGRNPVLEVPPPPGVLCEDVGALPPLREAVLGAVHHAPLHGVAERGQAREDNREIAAALGHGALEQSVDVLEQHVPRGALEAEEPVDIPPEDALLALDAARHGEGLGHGVVLAREAADDHVDVGDVDLPGLVLVEHPVDVLVDERSVVETLRVASGGELLRLGSGGLPLVRPDGLEGTRRGQVELRVPRVVISVQAEPEPADAREELGDLDGLPRRHVSPIAAVSLMSRPS